VLSKRLENGETPHTHIVELQAKEKIKPKEAPRAHKLGI
jgi:hypothetical protein